MTHPKDPHWPGDIPSYDGANDDPSPLDEVPPDSDLVDEATITFTDWRDNVTHAYPAGSIKAPDPLRKALERCLHSRDLDEVKQICQQALAEGGGS